MDHKINNEIYNNEIRLLEKQNEILKLKILNDKSEEDYRKINQCIWLKDIEINESKSNTLKNKII
jgi:hypothetical protein